MWRQVLATDGKSEKNGPHPQLRKHLVERDDYSLSGHERDPVFHNRGGRFVKIAGITGADSPTDGRGSSFVDLDNDGDLDILLRIQRGAGDPRLLVFRNNLQDASRWIRISLEGRRSGRDAAGAVVRVHTSKGVLTQLRPNGSGYLSQGDSRLLFGLGELTKVDKIEVTWPSGRAQSFAGVQAGTSLRLTEGQAKANVLTETRFKLPDPLAGDWQRLQLSPGQLLPKLNLLELNGEKRAGADLVGGGQPTLLNFWATWCEGCRQEMPTLQALAGEAGDSGLRVIGISLNSPAERDEVPAFLKAVGITYPVYLAGNVSKLYDAIAPGMPLPLTLLIDGQGRVSNVAIGETPDLLQRFGIVDGKVAPQLPPKLGFSTERLTAVSRAFARGRELAASDGFDAAFAACAEMNALLRPFCHEGIAAGLRGDNLMQKLPGVPRLLACFGLGMNLGTEFSAERFAKLAGQATESCRELAAEASSFETAWDRGAINRRAAATCTAMPDSGAAQACAHGWGRRIRFLSPAPREAIRRCHELGPRLDGACLAGIGVAIGFPFSDRLDAVVDGLEEIREPADRRAVENGVGLALRLRREIDASLLTDTWIGSLSEKRRATVSEILRRTDRCLEGSDETMARYWDGCQQP